MKKRLLAIAPLLIAGNAWAHHSFAVFFNTDDKVFKVTGVVKAFQFSNPHGVVTLAVRKGNGTTIWRAETNSPSILRRRGWTPDSLHVGDKVTLSGWLARDGTNYMRLQSAQLADGREVGKPAG